MGLIEKIVETESANRVLATPELLENSVTQAVLNEVSTMLPLLALAEGAERQKEVNRILTGLLMNYKLSNVGEKERVQRSTTTSFRWCRTR